ncbi:MAG: hypothetical protein Q4F65_06925 [Propionibacteriaceae bacterium]|nr:hypothetical protein [Propionibacteriaceae bacterium]
MGAGLTGVRTADLAFDGDQVVVDGHVIGDAAEVLSVAEQVRALVAQSDEAFIPVWWEQGEECRECEDLVRLDGFYRVTAAAVTVVRVTRVDVSVTLQRVRGFSAPAFELRVLGALRAGASGTPAYWHALPDAATGYEQGAITPAMKDRACAPLGRRVESRGLTVFTHAQLRDSTVDFFVSATDWYVGAPSLTVDGSVVVGRQVRQSSRWTLSNGVMRVHGVESSGAVVMDRWDGVRWVEIGEWLAGRPADTIAGRLPLAAPHALTVLHNSAELVAIRLSSDAASMYPGSRFVVNLDLSLRRGAPFVEVALSTRGLYKWGYRSPMLYTAMTATGDHLSTAGWQQAIGTRSDTSGITADDDGFAVVSEIVARQRQEWLWGVRPATDTVASVYAQWTAAMSERVSVVAR